MQYLSIITLKIYRKLNKKLKVQFLIIFLLIFSSFIKSSPYLEIEKESILELEFFSTQCEFNLNYTNFYPFPYVEILNSLESYKNKYSASDECRQRASLLHKKIFEEFFSSSSYISISSKRPDLFFQNLSSRISSNEAFYFEHSSAKNNISYRLRIEKTKNNKDDSVINLDESYINYIYKNHVIGLGKISRWWSSSPNTSLILSNSARPTPGITLSNYQPIIFENRFLKFMGPVSYEIFLNRLEKDRTIKNALFFGNRVTFRPTNDLNISLFRTAQFGGEERNQDIKTFLNMLIGRDNFRNNDPDKKNEPGNQLAGVDINKFFKKSNILLYGQLVGEDEAGYLPSRTFYQIGSSIYFNKTKAQKLNIEYADTGSRIENYVYEHNIYKSGYKYKNFPIGSIYGADSKTFSISYDTVFLNNINLSFKLYSADLNYNSKENFYLNGFSGKVNGFSTKIIKKITPKTKVFFLSTYNDKNLIGKSQFDFHMQIRYEL